MRFALKVLCAIFVLMLLVGAAFADATFTTSNTPDLFCSPGAPCGNIVVEQGSGIFLGDLVFTVSLEGPAREFQLDRFGFNSDLSLRLVCFAFGDSLCAKGAMHGASLETNKQFGPYGKFDYNLLTGLNGGQGCCKPDFTFVVAQTNGRALALAGIEDMFAGHAADKCASAYISGSAAATPEPSTLLLLGSALTAVAGAVRRRNPAK